MSKVIFISGPHGSGKTTLIKNLTSKYLFIEKNNFEIDFLKEYPSMPNMNMFERCLLRLYHRFYVGEMILKKYNSTDKVIMIDRGIHDSMAYSKVEYMLNEMDNMHYELLCKIAKECLDILNPYTIILNPEVNTINERLKKRKQAGTRPEREVLCAREDTPDYITKLHSEFEKYKFGKNILYITDNDIKAEKNIIRWIDTFE